MSSVGFRMWTSNLCTVQACWYFHELITAVYFCRLQFCTENHCTFRRTPVQTLSVRQESPHFSPHILLRLSSSCEACVRVCDSAYSNTDQGRVNFWSSKNGMCSRLPFLWWGNIWSRALFSRHVLFMALGTGCGGDGLLGFYCAGRLKMLNSDPACGNRPWFMCFFAWGRPLWKRETRERATAGRWKASKR